MSEKIPTIEEKKIAHSEIAELISPLETILESLNDSIETGDFDLVIGIDASGRIPALIFGEYINRIYKEKGYLTPMRRFLAGGANNRLMIEEQIKRWNPQKRVLVVEDTIVFGDSIVNLSKVLRSLNISFDIVSVGDLSYEDLKDLSNELGADHIYVGFRGTPEIYGEHDLGGVHKKEGETFARSYKKDSLEPEGIQDKINQSREDVDVVADELIKWRANRPQKQEDEK